MEDEKRENNQENSSAASVPNKQGKKKLIFVIIIAAVVATVVIGGTVLWYVKVYQEQIIEISAEYNGSTTAGTALDETNADIIVTGKKRNGETVYLSGDEWRVRSPKILEPDVATKLMIQYENVACYLDVSCSESVTESLSVEYHGATDAGTVIDIGSEGLTVTSTKKSGEVSDVTQQCRMRDGAVTLEPNKTSVVAVIYKEPLTSDELSAQTTVACTSRTVRNITVKYEGPAEDGEVLDSNNPYIIVTATYDTGEVENVDGWQITRPAVLETNQIAVVEVEFGGEKEKLTIPCKTVDEEAFKESCSEISYQELMRTPDDYLNQPIKVSGKIRNIDTHANTDSGYIYKIDVGGYDHVLVAYNGEIGDQNLLVDDRITCWGVFVGIDDSTYTEIPLINGRYIQRDY